MGGKHSAVGATTIATPVAGAGRGNHELVCEVAWFGEFPTRAAREVLITAVERAVLDVLLPDDWRGTRAYGAETATAGCGVRISLDARLRAKNAP